MNIEYIQGGTTVLKKGSYKDEKLVMVIEGKIVNVQFYFPSFESI